MSESVRGTIGKFALLSMTFAAVFNAVSYTHLTLPTS